MNNTTKVISLVAALGALSSAQAQVTIRITGSTAFRSAIYRALSSTDFYDAAPAVTPANASASTSTVTYKGKKSALFGTQDVIIETGFSGSVEGLINVLGSTASSPQAQPTFLLPDGSNDPVKTADLAFSDVAQETTAFTKGKYGTAIEFPADNINFAGQGVGVVTFAFVRNVNAGNLISNITSAQFQTLAGAGGPVSQGFFTGNASDSTSVYLTGRYSFSGTRLTVGAVTGLGANADYVIFSADSADNISGTGVVASPAVSANWNGGFISGGTLARLLNNGNNTEVIVGYMGMGDVRSAASTADKNVAQPLLNNLISFNGIAPSRANVIGGYYELWSYQHLYGKKSGVSSDVTKFVNGTSSSTPINSNGLIKALNTELHVDPDYIALDEMLSQRAGDGGLITPAF